MKLGAILAMWMGLGEALVLNIRSPVPDADRIFRDTILAYGALGAVIGALWAILWGRALRDNARRRLFHGISLPVLILLFQVIVYDRLSWRLLGTGLWTSVAVVSLEVLVAALAIAAAWLLSARRSGSPARRPALNRSAVALSLAPLVLVVSWPTLKDLTRPSDRPNLPNVVLIVMDTTRADRLSAFGYHRATTPELERIAAEGVCFMRAYSAAPNTLRSHASIFTGQQPWVHQARRHLDSRFPTLAEHLAGQGLLTVAVHKKPWLSQEVGLLRGFEQVFDLRSPWSTALGRFWNHLAALIHPPVEDAGARRISETMIAWLDRHGDAPFFAFLNYNEPHSRYEPPSPFRERYLGDNQDTAWGHSEHCDPVDYNQGLVDYGADDIAVFSDLYDAEVAYQDSQMGVLFDDLRQRGLLDDTLLIVTADHGESFGEHGLLGHGLCLYNSMLHVPLVVRFPEAFPAGVRVDTAVENRLLWPLIDSVLAGRIRDPDQAIEPLLESLGQPLDSSRPIFFEYQEWKPPRSGETQQSSGGFLRQPRRCVQLDSLKYICGLDGQQELYNVRLDPHETNNLAPERPEVVRMLHDMVTAHFEALQTNAVDEGPGLSEELQRELRGLGYLR